MPSNFLLTKYFFPLSQPIPLSSFLNFEFDNPRTDQEIAYAKRHISDLYESGIVGVLPQHSKEDVVTLDLVVKSFRDTYSKDSEYVKIFFRGYKKKDVFDYLAKMWCVIRFDDRGEIESIDNAYKEMHEKGEVGVILLNDESLIAKNSETLVKYSDLLALLSHTEGKDYFGRDFIFEPDQLHERKLFHDLTNHLVMLYSTNYAYKTRVEDHDGLSWIFDWKLGSKKILNNAALLEKVFANGKTEQLLYVGNLLGIANRTRDIKIRILILTSIIELLVTRSPDANRFNVEDSINKQFQLKASILVYMNDRKIDLDLLKKRLKTIYQQRSNIAHGNFGEYENYVRKLSKKEGEEEYLDDLVVDLYAYVRAILEEYLKDPKFVEFIKAG